MTLPPGPVNVVPSASNSRAPVIPAYASAGETGGSASLSARRALSGLLRGEATRRVVFRTTSG